MDGDCAGPCSTRRSRRCRSPASPESRLLSGCTTSTAGRTRAEPRQYLLPKSRRLPAALCDLHCAVEPPRGLCAVGTAAGGRADCACAVLAERRGAHPAGFLRSLRLDRLDPVTGADVLVVDFPDDSRFRLVQYGARIGAARGRRKPRSRRRRSRTDGRYCGHPPRDDDLLGLRRFHAISDHLGRESEIRDPLVFDPDRQPLGRSALRLRRVRIFRAVLRVADASGQAQPRRRRDGMLR